MQGIGFVFLIGVVVISNCAESRIELLPIESCPDDCKCFDINCAKKKDRIQCLEVEVVCRNANNVTSRLQELPRNSTRIAISGADMGHTTLDIFQRFTKLRKLALNNNGIRSLRLSQPLRHLDFLSLDDNRICFLPRRNMTLYLPRMKFLRVRRNNLTFIHENLFPHRLTQLDLSHNHIQSPRKGSFRRLRRLEILKLANNSIAEINTATFRFLTSLEILILDFNVINELGPDTFKLLPVVSLVSLKHNFIREIDPNAFKRMGIRYYQLHEIRLENNLLTSLDPSSFRILIPRRSIYSFYVAGNPIYCDCSTVSFRDQFDRLFRDVRLAVCASPPERRGTTIADLEIAACASDEDFYYDY